MPTPPPPATIYVLRRGKVFQLIRRKSQVAINSPIEKSFSGKYPIKVLHFRDNISLLHLLYTTGELLTFRGSAGGIRTRPVVDVTLTSPVTEEILCLGSFLRGHPSTTAKSVDETHSFVVQSSSGKGHQQLRWTFQIRWQSFSFLIESFP